MITARVHWITCVCLISEPVSGVYAALTLNFSVLESLQKESMGENGRNAYNIIPVSKMGRRVSGVDPWGESAFLRPLSL